MARRLGTSDVELEALRRGEFGGFQPAWRAALGYADAATSAPPRVSADTFTELAVYWTEPQVVEITAVVALFNYFNRFALALDVPVTR